MPREAFPSCRLSCGRPARERPGREQRAPVVPAGLSCQALAGPLLSGTAARPTSCRPDIQLTLAGADGGSADRGVPVNGIPVHPAVVTAKAARHAQVPMPPLELAAAIVCMTRLEVVDCQIQLPARTYQPRVTQTGRSIAGHSRPSFIQRQRRRQRPATMAMLILTGAKIGDMIGRRRAFVIGLIIYACGSALTALSQSVAVLALGWSVLENNATHNPVANPSPPRPRPRRPSAAAARAS